MRVRKIKVGIGKKISRKDPAENWGSWEIFYGAEADLDSGETLEASIQALDANIRDLVRNSPGFSTRKLLT